MATTERKSSAKKQRGRPRKKIEKSQEKPKAPKLTLAQKQALKLKKQKEKEAAKHARGEDVPSNKDRFYCTNKELQAELIAWRDSAKVVEDRIISERLGTMMMAIANKLLNHSNFRNYPHELKQDMASYFYYKLIRGLKNYNFEFSNPFAWCTQCAWNAFLTVIGKHYKHINIKRDLLMRLSEELESYSGISPNTSLNKCIKQYIETDYGSTDRE